MAWLTQWWSRRKALREATFKADLACIAAKEALAPYRAKAEIEWDIKWASPLDRTWRDELIVLAMMVPLVAYFIPGPTHDYAVEALAALTAFDPNAPMYLLAAWATLFLTTFGTRQVRSLFMPGRLASLVTAMANAKDDVPDAAVENVQRQDDP